MRMGILYPCKSSVMYMGLFFAVNKPIANMPKYRYFFIGNREIFTIDSLIIATVTFSTLCSNHNIVTVTSSGTVTKVTYNYS